MIPLIFEAKTESIHPFMIAVIMAGAIKTISLRLDPFGIISEIIKLNAIVFIIIIIIIISLQVVTINRIK